jgi:hypothetical protein
VITQITHIAPQQLSSSAATSQSHSALVIYIVIVHCTPLRLLQAHHCIQPPPPVIIDEEPEYEISKILNSKLDKRRACKLLYLVRWSRYEGTDEETSWILANELRHASKIVSEFHLRYPNKPGPLSDL